LRPFEAARALFRKDLRVELRSRVGWGLLAASAVNITIAVSFAFGGILPDPFTAAALVWVILLLASMTGVLQTFVREQEQGTAWTVRLWADPSPVLAAKLALNFLLLLGLTVLVVPLYGVLFALPIAMPAGLALSVLAGCAALAAGTTLLAAIAAATTARGLLLPLLALPLQLPSLGAAVRSTAIALTGQDPSSLLPALVLLVAQATVNTLLSFVLFRYIWDES
jgi:heme exporter protein B